MSPFSLPEATPLSVYPAGQPLWRIHRRYQGAIHFGVSRDWRFSAPGAQFGVCYLGQSLGAAFLETLIRGSRHRMVARSDLAARSATVVPAARDAVLLRLHSDGLVALALSADFPHRVPYNECQEFALEVWRSNPRVDGIEYRSRWSDDLFCVALFDRAQDVIGQGEATVALDDLAQMRGIFRQYDIAVI